MQEYIVSCFLTVGVVVYFCYQILFSTSGSCTSDEVAVITVDASGAGEGHLDVTVSHDARNVPSQVNTGQAGRHHVSFVPDSPGLYQIRIYFAGVEISGKPRGCVNNLASFHEFLVSSGDPSTMS